MLSVPSRTSLWRLAGVTAILGFVILRGHWTARTDTLPPSALPLSNTTLANDHSPSFVAASKPGWSSDHDNSDNASGSQKSSQICSHADTPSMSSVPSSPAATGHLVESVSMVLDELKSQRDYLAVHVANSSASSTYEYAHLFQQFEFYAIFVFTLFGAVVLANFVLHNKRISACESKSYTDADKIEYNITTLDTDISTMFHELNGFKDIFNEQIKTLDNSIATHSRQFDKLHSYIETIWSELFRLSMSIRGKDTRHDQRQQLQGLPAQQQVLQGFQGQQRPPRQPPMPSFTVARQGSHQQSDICPTSNSGNNVGPPSSPPGLTIPPDHILRTASGGIYDLTTNEGREQWAKSTKPFTPTFDKQPAYVHSSNEPAPPSRHEKGSYNSQRDAAHMRPYGSVPAGPVASNFNFSGNKKNFSRQPSQAREKPQRPWERGQRFERPWDRGERANREGQRGGPERPAVKPTASVKTVTNFNAPEPVTYAARVGYKAAESKLKKPVSYKKPDVANQENVTIGRPDAANNVACLQSENTKDAAEMKAKSANPNNGASIATTTHSANQSNIKAESINRPEVNAVIKQTSKPQQPSTLSLSDNPATDNSPDSSTSPDADNIMSIIATIDQAELQKTIEEGEKKKYRRLFVPGYGWTSAKRLKQALREKLGDSGHNAGNPKLVSAA